MKKLKRLFWFVPALAVSTAIVPVVTSCSQEAQTQLDLSYGFRGDIVLKDGTILNYKSTHNVTNFGFYYTEGTTTFIPWTSVAYIKLS